VEAAWAVVAAVSARAEKCVSPFSHYKPTADLTPFMGRRRSRASRRAPGSSVRVSYSHLLSCEVLLPREPQELLFRFTERLDVRQAENDAEEWV